MGIINAEVDDGAIFYANGVEIGRVNMPNGPVTADTLAPLRIDGALESFLHVLRVEDANIVSGTNVFAVEVHQNAATSSDVRFDMNLLLQLDTGQSLPSASPAPAASVIRVSSSASTSPILAASTVPYVNGIGDKLAVGRRVFFHIPPHATNCHACHTPLLTLSLHSTELAPATLPLPRRTPSHPPRPRPLALLHPWRQKVQATPLRPRLLQATVRV